MFGSFSLFPKMTNEVCPMKRVLLIVDDESSVSQGLQPMLHPLPREWQEHQEEFGNE